MIGFTDGASFERSRLALSSLPPLVVTTGVAVRAPAGAVEARLTPAVVLGVVTPEPLGAPELQAQELPARAARLGKAAPRALLVPERVAKVGPVVLPAQVALGRVAPERVAKVGRAAPLEQVEPSMAVSM